MVVWCQPVSEPCRRRVGNKHHGLQHQGEWHDWKKKHVVINGRGKSWLHKVFQLFCFPIVSGWLSFHTTFKTYLSTAFRFIRCLLVPLARWFISTPIQEFGGIWIKHVPWRNCLSNAAYHKQHCLCKVEVVTTRACTDWSWWSHSMLLPTKSPRGIIQHHILF